MIFPTMTKIKQSVDHPFIDDISSEVKEKINKIDLSRKKGKSVAITCGSRGIADYYTIIKSLSDELKSYGMKPFIVPAMGSHGGATPEGQKLLLEHLGLNEKRLKIPIKSSMEVVQIGETENVPVFIDKNAAEADYILLFHIIKDHSDFYNDTFGTGWQKMLTIGLGKQKGAEICHSAIMRHGFVKIIQDVSHKVIKKTNILLAMGVVQNGLNKTAEIEVCSKEEIPKVEERLFKQAIKYTMKLPFNNIDILIIDEMGKEYSGAGFETKVVGRIGLPLLTREPIVPKIKRIIVCDLTKATEGNAIGVGNADFITKKLYDKIDFDVMYLNALTALETEIARIPMVLETDMRAIEVAIKSIGSIPFEELRVVRIKNTKDLGELYVSKPLVEELEKRRNNTINITIEKEIGPISFDNLGNIELFR